MTEYASKLVARVASTTCYVKDTIFGTASSQESSGDAVEQRNEVTNPHSSSPLTVTPGKRGRTSDETEFEHSKKRQKNMSYGADRVYPEKVQAIRPPSPEPERPGNESMAQSYKRKSGGFGYRAMNTLNDNRHAAGTGALSQQGKQMLPRNQRLNHQGLAVRSSAGANTQPYQSALQFEESEDQFVLQERAPKRTKISETSKNLAVGNDTIDLTDDTETTAGHSRVQDGAKGAATHSKTGVHSSSHKPSPGAFTVAAANEAHVVWDKLEVQQAKKPRKPRTSMSQRSISICSAENEVMDDKRRSPTIVVRSPTSTSVRPQTKQRPPINLGDGVDKPSNLEATNQSNKTPGERERELSARIGARSSWSETRNVKNLSVCDITNDLHEGKVVDPLQQSEIALKRKFLSRFDTTQSREKSLNSTFQRDDGEAGPGERRRKVVDRMQEHSRSGITKKVSPIDEDSDDELNGPPTITSSTPRNPAMNRQARRPSSSDIPRTKFTTRANAASKEFNSPNDQLPLPLEHDGPHVNSFHSSSCVAINGSVDLNYTSHPKAQIDIYDGNKKCNISLTEATVQKVVWSRESCNVYINGSSSAFSNGNICISFYDGHGREWFLQTIRSIWRGIVNEKVLEANQMEKLFIHQCNEIDEAHKRYVKTLTTKPQRQRKIEHQSDNDEIRYEPLRRSSSPLATTDKREISYGSRRASARQAQIRQKEPTPPLKWSEINNPKQWKEAVTYPATGPRRVTVDFHDLPRLDDGEFLNDNLVSFALKRIEENIASEHKDSVYFFNSFFYTSLMKKNGKIAFNYENVKRWTKNKDIFTIPFIVVPINLNFHWFVAIICNLPNVKRELDASSDIESDSLVDGNDEPATLVEKDEAANNKNMSQLSISENDGKTGDVFASDEDNTVLGTPSEITPAKMGRKSKRKPVPRLRTFSVDQPVIITLDSFGTSRSSEVRTLKDYVIAEADAKRGMKIELNELQGVTAKGIPEQDNYCDCGVYLVGYVEQFAKNPRQFVDKILKRDLGLLQDFDGFSPSEKRAEIRTDLLKLSEAADAQRIKEKRVKAAAKAGDGTEPVLPAKAKAKAKALEQPLTTAEESSQRTINEAPSKSLRTEDSLDTADSRKIEAVDDSQEEFTRRRQVSWTPAGRVAASEESASTLHEAMEQSLQNLAEDDEEMLDNGSPAGETSPWFKNSPYNTILERESSVSAPSSTSSETMRAKHGTKINGLDGANEETQSDEHSQSITIPESQEIL